MKRTLCEFIEFRGENDFLHQGLFFRSKDSDTTVIHVHGSCGNYSSFKPIKTLAQHYISNNINLLTFNTRGHDCITEGFFGDKYEYTGGSLYEFNDCVKDIESAIKFVKKESKNIILQGHSLGCDRIVTYQLLKKDLYPSILISPADSYTLQAEFLAKYGDTVENQIRRIEEIEDNLLELLPYKEYGVSSNGELYYIPTTKSTFLSIATGLPFKLFRIDKPYDFFLDTDAFVVSGAEDKLLTCSPLSMFELIKKRFRSVNSLEVPDSGHEITPNIDLFKHKVVEWIKAL